MFLFCLMVQNELYSEVPDILKQTVKYFKIVFTLYQVSGIIKKIFTTYVLHCSDYPANEPTRPYFDVSIIITKKFLFVIEEECINQSISVTFMHTVLLKGSGYQLIKQEFFEMNASLVFRVDFSLTGDVFDQLLYTKMFSIY